MEKPTASSSHQENMEDLEKALKALDNLTNTLQIPGYSSTVIPISPGNSKNNSNDENIDMMELTSQPGVKLRSIGSARPDIPRSNPHSAKNKALVEMNLIFVRIGNIDTANERYQADIFLQAKWREPKLDGSFHFDKIEVTMGKMWNPCLTLINAAGDPKEVTSYDVAYRGEDNSIAYIVAKKRIKAVFLEILELNHFPFDCQDLSVTVTSTEYSTEEVELVESPYEMSRINDRDAIGSQEWKLHTHVDVDCFDVINDCDTGPKSRSGIRFTCRVSRRFGFYFFNHILISCILCLMAFFSFSVAQDNFLARMQLCFIILLTTGAFKAVVSQNLPKIPYLTYLDKLILCNFMLIVFICLWHTITAVVPDTDATFNDKERFVMIGLGTVFVLYLIIFSIAVYFDAGGRRREMLKADKKFEERMEKFNSTFNY